VCDEYTRGIERDVGERRGRKTNLAYTTKDLDSRIDVRVVIKGGGAMSMSMGGSLHINRLK
jgi:hypothetical protein